MWSRESRPSFERVDWISLPLESSPTQPKNPHEPGPRREAAVLTALRVLPPTEGEEVG